MKKVILGATGSIGSSLSKKLVESGDQVHLVGRDQSSLSELAKNLNSSFTVCDVLEENFAEKIVNDLNSYVDKLISDEKKSKEQDMGHELVGDVTQELEIEHNVMQEIGWGKFLADCTSKWIEIETKKKSKFLFFLIKL